VGPSLLKARVLRVSAYEGCEEGPLDNRILYDELAVAELQHMCIAYAFEWSSLLWSWQIAMDWRVT